MVRANKQTKSKPSIAKQKIKNKTKNKMHTNRNCYKNTKDMWRMPSILDDPGKIIIMAGE